MKLQIKNLAQITSADIELGDFTVFIGPQASGKSILLQMMKLVVDGFDIKATIKRYGFDWKGNEENFLELYFGEGMKGVISDRTEIRKDGREFKIRKTLSAKRGYPESLFLIPAQRVISIQDEWPKNFGSFKDLDPYVVKQFSERLRRLMEAGLGSGKDVKIFPQSGRMKKTLRDKIDRSIFFGSKVRLDTTGPKRRIMLDIGNGKLPYMGWSAGQREFMPLLLGLYWLMPSSKAQRKENIKYVVIEEPEMGLHPRAIQALLLIFLELMYRGYRVIVSTHSPVVLELCWVMQMIQDRKAQEKKADEKVGEGPLFELFELSNRDSGIKNIFQKIITSTFKTYYFSREKDGIHVKDISKLELGVEETEMSEWGGITSFSSRASEIVSNLMS